MKDYGYGLAAALVFVLCAMIAEEKPPATNLVVSVQVLTNYTDHFAIQHRTGQWFIIARGRVATNIITKTTVGDVIKTNVFDTTDGPVLPGFVLVGPILGNPNPALPVLRPESFLHQERKNPPSMPFKVSSNQIVTPRP